MIGLRTGLALGLRTGAAIGLAADQIRATAASKFIAASVGQSNGGVGQGDSSIIGNATGLTTPYTNVTQYQITSQGPVPADPIVWSTGSPGFPVIQSLQPYTSSVANIAGATTTCMGQELAMMHYLDEVQPSKWAHVHFGVSGTSIASHWHPSSGYPTSGSGGVNLFHQMINALKDAETRLGGTIKVIYWGQGETDAQNATDAGNYQTNLLAVFDAIWTYFPNAKIVFNQLSSGCVAANTSTVRTAQANVAGLRANSRMFSVDDLYLLGDGYHFNTNSYNVLGYRAACQVLGAMGIADTHTWTIKGGKGFPKSAKEWETYLYSVSLVGYAPSLQWDLTQPSGNLVDVLQLGQAAATGTFTGTGATFQQIIGALTGIAVTDAATAKFATTSGTLPNPSTDACAAAFFGNLNGTPAAIRTPLLLGTTTMNARIDTTPHFRSDSGANNAVGTANPTGGPRPYMIANDPGGGTAFACTDQEFLTPTRGAPIGKQFGIAFTASPPMTYLEQAMAWGPRVKFTQAQMRTFWQGLGWTIPW